MTSEDRIASALADDRPLVLVLGQALDGVARPAPSVFASALDHIGQAEKGSGWSDIFAGGSLTPEFYSWLDERFQRRPLSPGSELIAELPWSAIFTSSLNSTLPRLFSHRGRAPEVILTAAEQPRTPRSRRRPPLYYLFGRAGVSDIRALPPIDRQSLLARRVRDATALLTRLPDSATSLGLVAIDGYAGRPDWLQLDGLVGALLQMVPGQTLWFGPTPDDADFQLLIESGHIHVDKRELATVLALMNAAGQLAGFRTFTSDEADVITLDQGVIELTSEQRIKIESSAFVVDDSWSAAQTPTGQDAKYAAFREFHGDLARPRDLVAGVVHGFAIQRDFEQGLQDTILSAVSRHQSTDRPIIIQGQSGTGKTVALLRVIATIQRKRSAAIIFAPERVPHAIEVDSFCEIVGSVGAITLLIVDANEQIDRYEELLISLRSRGRRVVVVGSSYRTDSERPSRYLVEAPSEISASEAKLLTRLVEDFTGDNSFSVASNDTNVLAALYRLLPAGRGRIAAQLGAEARAWEVALRTRAERAVEIDQPSKLAAELVIKGFATGYGSLFTTDQTRAIEGHDSAGRAIDFVMVAGQLDCPIPINLLMRAVSPARTAIDQAIVRDLFDLDLFRWHFTSPENGELLVGPRLGLEAELICRRRMAGTSEEGDRIVELIRAARIGNSIDYDEERNFVQNILGKVGSSGPKQARYKAHYIAIGEALTEQRVRYGASSPSLMLQESVFRRAAIRENNLDTEENLSLLNEALSAVQTAIDILSTRRTPTARRMRERLLVERASIFGFIANYRAAKHASEGEIWSAFEAVRAAVSKAAGAADNYYPFDIALWTSSDLLMSGRLSPHREQELAAEIRSTIDSVDVEGMAPSQRGKFAQRRMRVAHALRDLTLDQSAFDELLELSSTAGIFLRAREIVGELGEDDPLLDTAAQGRAASAASFLRSYEDYIARDPKCLHLLFVADWISLTGRHPFRGDRQPLPRHDNDRRRLRDLAQSCNALEGENARKSFRYLEAVLTWVTGETRRALSLFQQLGRDTEFESAGRIRRRHVITDDHGAVEPFAGRVEADRGEEHWSVRVEKLNQIVDLLARDFPQDKIVYGREVRSFGIAFNYIGPIADPLARYRSRR